MKFFNVETPTCDCCGSDETIMICGNHGPVYLCNACLSEVKREYEIESDNLYTKLLLRKAKKDG